MPFAASSGTSPNGMRHEIVPWLRSYAVNDDHGGAIGATPVDEIMKPKPLVYRTTSGALRSRSSFSIDGRSFDTTYSFPLAGSTAAPPQLAPPLLPGICTVLRVLGGVNRPSFRALKISSRYLARSA